MKQPLQGLGSLGVWRDQLAHDLPSGEGNPPSFAWSLSRNVRFKDGYAQKMSGHGTVYDPPSVEPYWLLPVTNGSTKYWLYAGSAKAYVVTNTTHTNITRQTAGNDVDYTATRNTWTGAVLTGIAIFNNGTDVPQMWAGNPASRAAALSNWPSGWTCKALRAYKQFLFALNVTKSSTNYPHLVQWSHPADPGTVPVSWDDTDATKDAGKTDLADDQGFVIDGMTLGDQFIVYKESSIWAAQYVGGTFVFAFRKVSTAAGLLCRNAVAACPRGHVFIAQGDIMLFNGVSDPVSLLEGKLKKYFFDTLDSTYYGQAFCAHNPTQNEVWICYPTAGSSSCTEAIVWNYVNNTLGLRDLPNLNHAGSGTIDATTANSWNADSDSWEAHERAWNALAYSPSAYRLMLASSNTKLYLADLTTSFAGVAFTAYVRREGMDFGDDQSVKTLLWLRLRVDAPAGTVLTVRVGGSMVASGGVAWSSSVSYTVGTTDKVNTFATGRYLAIHIETSAAVSWRIPSIDAEFEVVGEY